jgi:hypothetical protein
VNPTSTTLTLSARPQVGGIRRGNGCAQAGCTSTDLKAYKLAFRNQFTVLCNGCAAELTRIGLGLTAVERRVTDLPVLTERRKTRRPAWLERLTARDETGRAVA